MTINAIRRVSLSIAIPFAAASLLIGGIVQLGISAQESIALDDRFFLDVSEIQCNPPSGQDRITFLKQVHYYGQLPERLHLLDPDLSSRLTQAFQQHPEVKRVRGVTVSGGRQVWVDVVYRD